MKDRRKTRGGIRECRALAVALLLAAAGLLPATPVAAQELTLMTWGGVFHDAFTSVLGDLEKLTGVKVRLVTQAGAAAGFSRLKAQRQSPQVDLWTSIESTAQQAAQEGLVVPLDPARIPNMAEVPEALRASHHTSIWVSLRGIFYRADMVPFEIKRWEDLWDPRLQGKVAVTLPLDKGSFLIMAALLAGGSEHNIDPGFEKVKALRPNIALFFKTDAESIKFLQAGEAGVVGWGILPNVYKLLGPGSNYRFVIPERPQFLAPIPIQIVAGRPHTAAAEKVLNTLLSAEIQEKLVEQLGSVPANRRARAPEKIRGIVPPLTNIYKVDWGVVNANFDKWTERWNREIQTR